MAALECPVSCLSGCWHGRYPVDPSRGIIENDHAPIVTANDDTGARTLFEEVMEEGNEGQRESAKQALGQLG